MQNPSILKRLAAVALLAASCLGAALPARAEDYRLGAQDKVRIKVVDWQAGEKQLYEWIELTGDYFVRDRTNAYANAKGKPSTFILDLNDLEAAEVAGSFDSGAMVDEEDQRGYQFGGVTAEEGFLIGKALQSLWDACG